LAVDAVGQVFAAAIARFTLTHLDRTLLRAVNWSESAAAFRLDPPIPARDGVNVLL
jgi:hypothetical protein